MIKSIKAKAAIQVFLLLGSNGVVSTIPRKSHLPTTCQEARQKQTHKNNVEPRQGGCVVFRDFSDVDFWDASVHIRSFVFFENFGFGWFEKDFVLQV